MKENVCEISGTSKTALQAYPLISNLAIGLALFFVIFSLTFVSYTRTMSDGADEMLYFGLTQSLARGQGIALDQISTVGPGPEEIGIGGHRYSKKGPLASVLGVPLYWLAQRTPLGAVDTVLLQNGIITGLIATLFFLLVRRLGYSVAVGLALAAIVTLGTPLFVYAKLLFSEPTITLAFVATLLGAHGAATTRKPSWIIATGVVFGLSVAAKYVDILLLLPVPLYLAWNAGDGKRIATWSALETLLWFSLGAAPIGVLLLGYDFARYGVLLDSGYGTWETFSTPVWVGVSGLLFSPGKSIIVYTPLFLMLPFWAPRFFRRFPRWSAMLGAIVLLNLVVYGSWYVWWGAWGWGSRFTVPMLPILVLALAEGLATSQSVATKAIFGLLTMVSVGIQVLGAAIHYDVDLLQLLPINPRPDTLTLYNLARSPILAQIPLLRRRWLDFAWINRTGPEIVNRPALLTALACVLIALLALAIVTHQARVQVWLPAITVSALVISGGVYRDLRLYSRPTDPTIERVAQIVSRAPDNAAILQMIPDSVEAWENWQKSDRPELGWIEEPKPSPLILHRLAQIEQRVPELWVVTETPPKVPSNGVEALLDRSLAQRSQVMVGRFRVLQFATKPDRLQFDPVSAHFSNEIALTGFLVTNGPPAPGRSVSIALRWEAGPTESKRPSYTVFAHVLTPNGTLIAQNDDPPASGYEPTDDWRPGEVIYDDHSLTIPADAPPGPYRLAVGLYLPSTGARVPLLRPGGKLQGDTVTLDIGRS